MKEGFYKQYGANVRQDGIIELSANNYVVFFGFGKDDENDEFGYNWRKNYDHRPSVDEIRSDIEDLVNSQTDEKILSGFVWKGFPVWLSSENQFNFKFIYDLALQKEGATLPVTFKIGQDSQGEPIYHTFDDMEEFSDFIMSAFGFIMQTVQEGWNIKDNVDYNQYDLGND